MAMFGPVWWHHHGIKMRVDNEQYDEVNRRMVLVASAASVEISRADDNEGWYVDWTVIQGGQPDIKVTGRRCLTNHQLAAAFGLIDEVQQFGSNLVKELAATTASQGLFIRYKKYLNIPCPGTGHDGDPNVSIYLDPSIMFSVFRLLRLAYSASDLVRTIESEGFRVYPE